MEHIPAMYWGAKSISDLYTSKACWYWTDSGKVCHSSSLNISSDVVASLGLGLELGYTIVYSIGVQCIELFNSLQN